MRRYRGIPAEIVKLRRNAAQKEKKKKVFSLAEKKERKKKKKSLLEGEDYLVGEAASEPLRW